MSANTLKDLKERVAQLVTDGKFEDAQRLASNYFRDHPDLGESELGSLLEEIKDKQNQYQPDPLKRTVERARLHLEHEQTQKAFDLLQIVLEQRPDDREALDLLVRCTDKDASLKPAVQEFLQSLPNNPAIASTLTKLEGAPSGATPRTTATDEFDRLFDEGMNAYRGRDHRRAIGILQDILQRAPKDSRVYRDTSEYLQKAQERLDRGEFLVERLPADAVQNVSRARSAMRAGHFQTTVDLLSEAIKQAHSANVDYPKDWDQVLEDAGTYLTAQKDEERAEVQLREYDNWDDAIKILTRALRAYHDGNPLLAERLQLLSTVDRELRIAESFLNSPSDIDPEGQAARIIELNQVLRSAATEFPQSKRVRATLLAVQEKTRALIEILGQQADKLLKQARNKNVALFSARLKAAERAAATFELMARLGDSSALTTISLNSAQELAQHLQEIDRRFKEADELADQHYFDAAANVIEDLRSEVPNDQRLRALVQRLASLNPQLHQVPIYQYVLGVFFLLFAFILTLRLLGLLP